VTERPSPAHLILIGLPGAGKSAHGKRVARLLKRPFVDLDREIERVTGRAVAEIFASDGEPAFRAMEHQVTEALAAMPQSVVAPGGGWILDPANVALVKPGARLVWLQVQPAAAVLRMGARIAKRPLLAHENPVGILTQLLEERRARYACADHVVDTEAYGWHKVAHLIAALAPTSSEG
jgi:shikimate kinase